MFSLKYGGFIPICGSSSNQHLGNLNRQRFKCYWLANYYQWRYHWQSGGGWTLIMTNNSSSGWNATTAILRNETAPGISSNYSIISYADYIKKSNTGFQYMIDPNTREHWGGIWTANQPYSFVNTTNTNTDITLNSVFGSWLYNDGGIEQIMPWYAPYNQGIITTSSSPDGNWWGTLIANSGWNPVPWLVVQGCLIQVSSGIG